MDDKLWWWIARAGGLTGWALLAAAVIWGLLLSTRIAGTKPNSAWTLDLHRFLGALALVFTGVHLAGLVLDSYISFGWAEILVPFASDYRPGAVAWGVVGLYLLIAIQVTSWSRGWIPRWLWRGVHLTTVPLFAVATVHLFTAGSEAALPALQWMAVAVVGMCWFLLVYRLLTLRWRGSTRSGPVPAVTDSAPDSPAVATLGDDARDALVRRVEWEADGVLSLGLTDQRGRVLPPWRPGAHIDLVLPSGTVRQYSLCGDPGDRGHYQVAVLHVPDGRGGSTEIHDLRPGQRVAIRGPRNTFALVDAPYYLLIAGGIGITPLLTMARELARHRRSWRLVYGGRSLTSMAFADELRTLGADRVTLVPQDTDGLPDLAAALHAAPDGSAVYCCGPEALLSAVERLMPAVCPTGQLHVERFAPQPASNTAAPDAPFEIELRRTGKVLQVPTGRTALDVIREAVPNVPASCAEGICGSCAVRVLAGVPDHRDHVLSDAQRQRGDVMHPCVSRARTPRITLDL